MDRRHFLKSLAGGLVVLSGDTAFSATLPVPPAGRRPRPAPGNRIVMAAIGCGNMGEENLRAFLQKDEVQMVAVCDVDRTIRDRARQIVDAHYGNRDCRTYTDFRELIGRGDLDAVMIATPDHWHGIIAVTAARAGLDIYGEKPLSHTLGEGRAIVDAVRRYGRIWQTGSWQRSLAHFRRACELVRNGRLGRVHTVELGLGNGHRDYVGTAGLITPEPPPAALDYDLWLGPAPWSPYCGAKLHRTWRWFLDYGGGKLMDWIGHHGDIALWGLGLEDTGPVEVEGTAEWPDGVWNAPRHFHAVCRYPGDLKIVLSSRLPEGTKWIGERGSLFVSRGRLESDPASVLSEPIGPGEIRLYHSTDHHQNFLDCVRSRREAIAPAEAAHRAASLGHLAQIAFTTGRKLRWDPEAERFVNDAEANRLLSPPMRAPWVLP